MRVVRRSADYTTAITGYELHLAPSPFELFAASLGYDVAPAVSPSDIRQYADKLTQEAFDAWNAGACYVAGIVTESTLETRALVERVRELANTR